MARLNYGGIELEIVKTHQISAEDVYDDTGLDLLWTKYVIDITGVVNPAATAYGTVAGNPQPQPTPGTPAFLTLANIRDTLSLPRQQLVYRDELGNILVQSPASAPVQNVNFRPGQGIVNNIVQPPVPLDCDCDGGPRPLRPPEILAVQGTGKTVLVRFAVSTTVNDSIFWSGQGGLALLGHAAPKPPVILSNRWSVQENLDEAAFSTRVYRGHVIFRADLLRAVIGQQQGVDNPPAGNRLAVPDDFRSYWANFYCPQGFQRAQVWVQEDPSGFAVDYQVTDVQKAVSAYPGETRAYKIEAVRRTGVSRPRPDEDIRFWGEEGPSLAGAYRQSFEDIFNPDTYRNPGPALGRQVGMGVVNFISAVPRVHDEMTITAFGQPGSNRTDLAKLCYKVLVNAGEIATVPLLGSAGVIATLEQDLMGKWVRLHVVRRLGPMTSLFQVGGNPNGVVANMLPVVQPDDGIFQVTTSTPGVNPVFPNDSNTRGTALEALVAQSLMYPYNEAPQPPGDTAAFQGIAPP